MDNYDYSTAGYDQFLTRSIDSNLAQTLDQSAAMDTSRQNNFEQNQTSGVLGDIFRIGNIELNGTDGVIRLRDKDGREVLSIGDPDNPGQLTLRNGGLYAFDKDGNPTVINGKLVGNRNLGSVTIDNVGGNILGTTFINYDQEMVDTSFSIQSTHIRFTVPDGVTRVRITLSSSTTATGLAIFDKPLSSTDQTINAGNRLFEATGGASIYATRTWYHTVVPGAVKDYFVASEASGVTESMTVSKQLPLTFSIDIP